jgi:DNA oxidative demethylase
VPGFSYVEDFISQRDEAVLIAAIDAVELAPFRFQGWVGKRLTASFGWRYDFDRASFEPATPIPDFLLEVRQRAAAFADLAPPISSRPC